MRRGGDMHGKGGTEGSWGAALVAVVPTLMSHPAEVRQSVHSGRGVNDHPAAGTRTFQSGGHLAAVNGGIALRALRHSTIAPRGSCGTGASAGGTRKFIGTTRTSRVSTAWRESDGSPHAL